MDLASTNIVVLLIVLIISLTLHEAMHAYTSHWLGDDTAQQLGRISLNPLKHIDLFGTVLLPLVTVLVFGVPLLVAKPVPFNPNRVKFDEFGAALVGAAGPLTNLAIALIVALFVRFAGSGLSDGVFNALLLAVQLNVALFIFNMIPIPPLDGSRVLYAFAPEPLQAIMASLERMGILIVFALILLVPAFSTLLINIDDSLFRLLIRL